MEIKTALVTFGLKEKEAEVYITLLKMGQNTAQNITKQTGILRQSVYDILGKLGDLGIISKITENNKTYFKASSPEKFKEILEGKKNIIDQILPNLVSLKRTETNQPDVQIYRGLKNLKSIFSNPLISKEILSIQPMISEKFMKDYYVENFIMKRLDKKIPIKIIRGGTKGELQKKIITNKKEFREVRIIKSFENMDTHIIIYDDKVLFNIYREEPASIFIKDSFISNSIRLIFNNLWANGKTI